MSQALRKQSWLRPTPSGGASMADTNCTINGCTNSPHAKGLCNSHYGRQRRHGNPLAGRLGAGQTQKFIEYAAAYVDDECLIWPHGYMGNGYGIATLAGRQTTAHRLVLELYTGKPADPQLVAAHNPVQCHNPACVNPKHLRWATHQDNQRDRLADQTDNRGERHGNAKLSNDDVVAIFTDQRPQKQIADHYSISQPTVSDIKRGYRWRWLTGAK